MIRFALNPFRYIAGWKSLWFGCVILVLTSIIGYFSRTHFPDLISVKTNAGFPFSLVLVQNLVNWLFLSATLYFAALILKRSKFRVVDVFGTQALSRLPYLIVTLIGFSQSLLKFSDYLLWHTLKIGRPIEIALFDVVVAVLLLLISFVLTVWMIALMVNAFKVSTNLKGIKLVLGFIISFLIAMVGTSMFSTFLIKTIV